MNRRSFIQRMAHALVGVGMFGSELLSRTPALAREGLAVPGQGEGSLWKPISEAGGPLTEGDLVLAYQRILQRHYTPLLRDNLESQSRITELLERAGVPEPEGRALTFRTSFDA